MACLGNFGLAILAVTVVMVKAAFFWFANKSYESMAKMKLVQPRDDRNPGNATRTTGMKPAA